MNTAAILLVDSLYQKLEELRRVCAEAYQVVGYISDEFDVFDHPDVQKALDNLSAAANKMEIPHADLLPWPKSPLKESK